jgi:uridine kinase
MCRLCSCGEALVKNLFLVGPSCCGKSTLAKILGAKLNLPVFSLDDYYIEGADPLYVFGPNDEVYQTWERPYMYDGNRLAADIPATGAIIEGFILFQYQSILDLTGLRVYLDLPFNECLRRRKLRPRHSASDLSFEMIGEKENTEFVLAQKDIKDVVVFNANASIDDLTKQIFWEYILFNESRNCSPLH